MPKPPPRVLLERCVEHCSRPGWRLAYSVLRDREAAFDAVQQAFVVAATKPERIPRDDPWPWFSTVLMHECRNYRRKKRPVPVGCAPVETRSPDEGPDEKALVSETRERLWGAIDELSETEREAVVLTHVAGLTHERAAQLLGLSRQAVTSALGRAFDRLRHLLGDTGESEASTHRGPDPLASRLAALPLIDPPGGWSGALDLWKRKALLSVGSTGGASAAVSGGGVIFMSTKWIWAAGIAVAVGLGFVGGRTSLDFFRSRPSSADVSDARSSSAADVVASDLEATVDRLEAENRELRRDRDARRAEAERLSSELAAVSARVDTMDKTASGGGPPHGPVFTFGVSGQLEAVHEANWPEIADSSQRIAEDVREILSYQESGEKPPRELLIHLQEHTERVRKYEYRTIGKLPTAGRHNGELTHPISLTNTFAQILETAGAPLTPEQIARIEALGLSFETEFERLRSGYSEGTPRVERLLDEYSLKGAFVDDLYAVLTAAQRGIVVDEETQRIAGLDLYCPTLLIIHTSPVVQGATLEEIVGKMKTLLTQSLELSTDEVAALDSPLSQWAQDIAGLLEPVTAAHATHYHYDEGAQAGRATVALYRSMLREVPLDEASRARLLDDYAFYIPRIVPAPPQG